MHVLATLMIWLGLEQRNLTGRWHRLVGVSQAEVEEADTDKLRIAQLIVGALQIEVSIALHGLSGVTIVAVRAPQCLMCIQARTLLGTERCNGGSGWRSGVTPAPTTRFSARKRSFSKPHCARFGLSPSRLVSAQMESLTAVE